MSNEAELTQEATDDEVFGEEIFVENAEADVFADGEDTDTEEASTEEVEEQPEEDEQDEIGDQFARLQADLERRDKELIERSAYLKGQEKELQQLDNLRELVNSNPMEAARQLGMDPQRLAEEFYFGNDLQEEEPEQSSEVATLSQQIEELKSHIAQGEQRRAIQNEMDAIKHEINSKAEDFPFIAALAGENDLVVQGVFEAIGEQYQKTGELPEIGETLAGLEKMYFENVVGSLGTLSKIPMVREKLVSMLSDELKQSTSTSMTETLTNEMMSDPNLEDIELDEQESDELFYEIIQKSSKQ